MFVRHHRQTAAMFILIQYLIFARHFFYITPSKQNHLKNFKVGSRKTVTTQSPLFEQKPYIGNSPKEGVV